MNHLTKFPKIFALGNKFIRDIFDDEVEITCKLDGSCFHFGLFDGELKCSSKNKEIILDNPEKMFEEAVNYIISIKDKLPNNVQFTAEYLKKPKHNTLKYDRIPKNHLMLFAVHKDQEYISDHETLEKYANSLDIDVAPLLYYGKIETIDRLNLLLDTESYLGGIKIEGIVVKNYNKAVDIGGHIYEIMCGKLVSEKFKEVNNKEWKANNTRKGKFETLLESYRTEARWLKAVQSLRDAGELEEDPKDIGKLIKYIQQDIVDEEKEEIKDKLWNIFKDQILRKSTAGAPEWYKSKLAEKSFKEE